MKGLEIKDILALPLIIVVTWLVSEFVSYLWHRFAAHFPINSEILKKYVLRGVRDSHKDHHLKFNMDKEHKALEDFLWVSSGLCCLGVFWYGVSLMDIFPNKFILASMTTSIVFGIWKCYVHAAYHTEKHFLNRFEFFRQWKIDHCIHHDDPKSNFSLSWFIPDKIFNTYRSEKKSNKVAPAPLPVAKTTSLEDID